MIRHLSEHDKKLVAINLEMDAENVARKAGFKDAWHMRDVARRWMRVKEPVARPLMRWGNQQ